MSESINPRIRTLLRQANRVAGQGKRAAAETLYRQVIEEAPEEPGGWIGLASILRDPAEQTAAYERALALEPGHEAALKGLAILQGEAAPEPADRVERSLFDENRDWLDEATARQRFDEVLVPAKKAAAPAELPEATVTETVPDPVDEEPTADVAAADTDLFCYRHPKRDTYLRCSSCGKPICSDCAKSTPVGYRCPQCIKERQDVFYQATFLDYFLAVLVTLPVALFIGYFISMAGFLVIFLGAAVGSVVGRLVLRVTGRRRGRWMPHLVAGCLIAGGLIGFLVGSPLWVAVYLFFAPAAAFYQLK